MFKWFKTFLRHKEMQTTCKSEADLNDNGTVCLTGKRSENIAITYPSDMVFPFIGNKSKKDLEAYINSRPDCKFISCARAKNSSGFVLKFSCKLSTVSATLPEECHIFIDKYNLSITELTKC